MNCARYKEGTDISTFTEHEHRVITAEDLLQQMNKCKSQSQVLICLFCIEGYREDNDLTLFYLLEDQRLNLFFSFVFTSDGSAPSIAGIFSIAVLYEREISDGFGIEFTDAYDTRRLFLHESYPEDFHPLRKSYLNGHVDARLDIPEAGRYTFKKMDGKGIYEVAVGPVHAGIIEPGHFRFSVFGETICNLEIRMGYLHRGIEKTAEGEEPKDVLAIAESISGDESAANTACFCMAIEKIQKINRSLRSQSLTGIALEMERISCLLSDCSGMLIDVAYPAGAAPFQILKEECMRMNKKIFSHRFIRGYIRIGGVSHDISSDDLNQIQSFLEMLKSVVTKPYESVISSPIVLDRFSTTGIIEPRLIYPLNLTGPIARASGSKCDTRVDYPYGIYQHIPYQPQSHDGCDVLSRFIVKYEEIMASCEYIQTILQNLPDDGITPLECDSEVNSGVAYAMVEGPRGQNIHFVMLRDGKIWRYKIRTASFCNWIAIEHAAMGNIVPDFPLINKSLNLSYAGNDL